MDIRQVQTEADVRQVVDFCAKIFSGDGYFESARGIRRKLKAESSRYDRDASVIAVDQGRVVGHVGVIDYPMRVGTGRLRCGGLSGVSVHPRYRKKGLCTKLLGTVLEKLGAHGYDVSMLFGIPDFYHRFGYAPCLAWTALDVSAGDIPPRRTGLKLRVATKKHIPTLARLYDAENAERTGTLVRTELDWKRALHKRHYLLRQGSKPVGYVRFGNDTDSGDHNDALAIEELAVEPREAALRGMLHSCLLKAGREHKSKVRFNIPTASPMGAFLKTKDCRVTSYYAHNSDAQGRLINMPQCMDKAAGELSRRLRRSAFARRSLSLGIKCHAGSSLLKISRGKVRTLPNNHDAPLKLECTDQALMKLLVGYGTPLANLAGENVKISGGASELLGALFPETQPYLWATDHY